MTQPSNNVGIWDEIYQNGNFMAHPTEAFIRLALSFERRAATSGGVGIILDHGCGSGVNSEFLLRRGHRIHCTDVSRQALTTLSQRLKYRDLPIPPMNPIDPRRALRGQLPIYDQVVAWCSLLYNPPQRVQQDIQELIQGLPSGGAFIAAMPTPNDILMTITEPLADNHGRRVIQETSGQKGMIVTVPESLEQFISWCDGLEIIDQGQYSVTLGGKHSEHMVVYGEKKE
ncbi:MAG: class I SAM-dependent methyltransferase [Magnetococcales bacterium]|nr:class I SAM-dependent methyltransferase [Magnetococcales bacterium]